MKKHNIHFSPEKEPFSWLKTHVHYGLKHQ